MSAGTSAERELSTFTCTITPFDEDGELDVPAWKAHVDRLASVGMNLYVGSGSPGEGFALSLAETEQLYGTAVDTAAGRVQARAMGIEMRTAASYLELVQIAESVGIDAMQLYCVDNGHANKPTEAELEIYFRHLLDRSEIRCVLSSHMYSGYVIPVGLIGRLLDSYGPERVAGLNVTNGDLRYVSKVIEVVDGRCDVHVGGAMQALTILALGGQGFLSTDGNIIPRTCVEVIDGWRAGDVATASNAYAHVIRFFASNRWPGGSMRYLKAVMRVLEMQGHHLRPPFLPLEIDDDSDLLAVLRALEVPEVDALLASRSA